MDKGHGSEISPEYAAAPATVRVARYFVRATLEARGVVAVEVDHAELLTSELATNAVLHAKSPYTVTVDVSRGRVRIEVTDRSAAVAARRPSGPTSGDGRGLAIVEDMASAWGVEPRDDGKCIWFELSSGPPTD